MAFREKSKEDIVCSPCSRLCVKNVATHWCKNCTEYICQECFIFHQKIKQLSDHELTRIEEVTEEDDHYIKDIQHDIFCLLHADVIAAAFCLNDREAYCFDCLKSMNMSFYEVITLEQLVKSLDSTMLDKDVSTLNKMSETLRKLLHCIKKSETKFDKSVEDILQSIQQLATETKKKIDEVVMQTNNYLKEFKDNEQKHRVKQKQELGSFIDFIELQVKLLNTKKLTSKEIVAISLKTKHELNSKSESLRNSFEQTECHDIMFKPRSVFQQIKNIKSFGEMQIQRKPSTALETFQQIEEQINVLQQGLFPGPLTPVDKVSVKNETQLEKAVQTREDTQDSIVRVCEPRTEMGISIKKVIKCADINTRYLFDGAYLADGSLVVTDFVNDKLLLFDDSVTLQSQYAVKSHPRGVCANGSLIYVVYYDGTLVTYKLPGKFFEGILRRLRVVSHVEVQGGNEGVGVSGDTIITGQNNNISLYYMKGNKLANMKKQGYYTYICLSQDGSRCYHKDGDHIVCRTVSNLSEVFRFSNPKLIDPQGIACDRHGNILVAGYVSGNIIIIDKNGTQGRVLVDKLCGIAHPSGLCCHPQRDEFVVMSFGLFGGNDNAMEVYEIK